MPSMFGLPIMKRLTSYDGWNYDFTSCKFSQQQMCTRCKMQNYSPDEKQYNLYDIE